jgi:hypothetical protein
LANAAIQIAEDCEHLFAQPAFYAEFAPLERHSHFVDSIYVLKDQGRLTASRLTFASPFRELTFSYRDSVAGDPEHCCRVVVNEPSFGHRTKQQGVFRLDRRHQVQADVVGFVTHGSASDHRVPEFPGARHQWRAIASLHP